MEGAGRLGRRAPADSPVAERYKGSALYERLGTPTIGVSLGLQLAGFLQEKVFPSGAALAEMQAAAPAYTSHFDCTVFAGYGGTCEEACFGFAAHHMDPFYCATCDEQRADPANNPSYNWHFVGSRGQILYKDMENNACNGKDAWKWKVGACGTCQSSAVFRCHDGYKKYPNATSWDPTICQGLVSCDGRLTPC